MWDTNNKLISSKVFNLREYLNKYKNIDMSTMTLYEIQINEEFGIDIFYERIDASCNIEEFLLKTVIKSEDYTKVPRWEKDDWDKLENAGYNINESLYYISSEDAKLHIKEKLLEKNINDIKLKIEKISEAARWGKPDPNKLNLIFIDDNHIYLLSYY